MTISFNSNNFRAGFNPVTRLKLMAPNLLRQKNVSNLKADHYLNQNIKKAPIPLIEPNLFFSRSSQPAFQASSSDLIKSGKSGSNIQWERQFTDRFVVRGGIPKGYKSIRGLGLTMSKITAVAKEILGKNHALGTITPFQVDGKELIAVDQLHYATTRNGKKVDVPGGLHGVTVFIKA